MEQFILTPINPEILINEIADKITAKVLKAVQSNTQPETPKPDNPLSEYIPKTEVRGKLASNSTLWKYEKQGKLKLYGIGGKRYYKRSDIANLFTEVKQKPFQL